MTHATYSGSTDVETYSFISTFTSGSYYDDIKDTVLSCVVDVIQKRIKERYNIFTVADFGTADGVNFTQLLKEILEIVDANTGELQETMVFFEDQIGNDYNLLLSKLEGSQKALPWKHKAFFAAIGKSMYRQCLPTGSLDIGISSIAVHWMSSNPSLENGLTYMHADEQEMELYRNQASADWKSFLLSRGRELKDGGYLVVLLPVEGEGCCAADFLLGASEAWRRMFSRNKISKEEYRNTNLGFFRSRTEDDLKAPFHDSEVLSLGLRLVSMKPRLHLLKPLIQLRQDHDKVTYMKTAVKFVQPFIRNAIYQGLSDCRTTSEKEAITTEYFNVLFNVFSEADVKLDKLTNEEVVIQKTSNKGM